MVPVVNRLVRIVASATGGQFGPQKRGPLFFGPGKRTLGLARVGTGGVRLETGRARLDS
jgi:hypothetical protein